MLALVAQLERRAPGYSSAKGQRPLVAGAIFNAALASHAARDLYTIIEARVGAVEMGCT